MSPTAAGIRATRQWADELGRRIPDATVTIHPGGGHLIIATKAEAILPDLLPPT